MDMAPDELSKAKPSRNNGPPATLIKAKLSGLYSNRKSTTCAVGETGVAGGNVGIITVVAVGGMVVDGNAVGTFIVGSAKSSRTISLIDRRGCIGSLLVSRIVNSGVGL